MKKLLFLVVLVASITIANAQVKIVELGTYKEPTRLLNPTRMNVVLYPANMNKESEADWKAIKAYADNLLSKTPAMYYLTIFFVNTDVSPSTYPVDDANLPWASYENTMMQIRSHRDKNNEFRRCAWVVNNMNTQGVFPPGIVMSDEWCLDVK